MSSTVFGIDMEFSITGADLQILCEVHLIKSPQWDKRSQYFFFRVFILADAEVGIATCGSCH